jgi:type II secretory pathway component PulK
MQIEAIAQPRDRDDWHSISDFSHAESLKELALIPLGHDSPLLNAHTSFFLLPLSVVYCSSEAIEGFRNPSPESFDGGAQSYDAHYAIG